MFVATIEEHDRGWRFCRMDDLSRRHDDDFGRLVASQSRHVNAHR